MACRCRQESKCPFREFEQLRLLLPSTSGIARTCIHKTALVRREMSVLPTVFTNSEPARAFIYVFLMDKLLVYENASICWHNNLCMFMGTVFFSNKKMKITECNFKTVIRYQITYIHTISHAAHMIFSLSTFPKSLQRSDTPKVEAAMNHILLPSHGHYHTRCCFGLNFRWTPSQCFFSIKLEPVQRHRKRALRSSTPTDLCLGLELTHLANAIASSHFSICRFLLYDTIHTETSAKLNKRTTTYTHIKLSLLGTWQSRFGVMKSLQGDFSFLIRYVM